MDAGNSGGRGIDVERTVPTTPRHAVGAGSARGRFAARHRRGWRSGPAQTPRV